MWSKMYIGLHVKVKCTLVQALRLCTGRMAHVGGPHVQYPLFLSDFNDTWNFWTDFQKKKFSNINSHENVSSGSRVVLHGRADGHTEKHDEANSQSLQFCECAQKHCRNYHDTYKRMLYQKYGTEGTVLIWLSLSRLAIWDSRTNVAQKTSEMLHSVSSWTAWPWRWRHRDPLKCCELLI